MEIPFRKYEGCGNDYLYVDLDRSQLTRAEQLALLADAPQLSEAISDRHFGVGSDGLVLLDRPEPGAAAGDLDIVMHMFNADGSRGQICGNALRCVARILAEGEPERGRFRIGTDAGIKSAEVERDGGAFLSASIEMGEPLYGAEEIPFDPSVFDAARIGEGPFRCELPVAGGRYPAIVLSMGNPHCVIFVDEDPMELALESVGKALQTSTAFPASVNVELVRKVPLDEAPAGYGLEQRTYERGSGETLACGSGACAVAVAAIWEGLAQRGAWIPILLRGGELDIRVGESGGVTMRGPATPVFGGCYSFELGLS